jgi:hypothetical protein
MVCSPSCFTPVWWVSLTAPNYPPGPSRTVCGSISMNRVFNGCKKVEKAEIRRKHSTAS